VIEGDPPREGNGGGAHLHRLQRHGQQYHAADIGRNVLLVGGLLGDVSTLCAVKYLLLDYMGWWAPVCCGMSVHCVLRYLYWDPSFLPKLSSHIGVRVHTWSASNSSALTPYCDTSATPLNSVDQPYICVFCHQMLSFALSFRTHCAAAAPPPPRENSTDADAVRWGSGG
jgi:hypothetical protein